MTVLVLMLLCASANADSPFYLRGTNTNQSMGGLNQNFTDQNTLQHDLLTKTITPASCPTGQTLTGAFYNNGYVFGGTCSNVITSTSTYTAPVSSETYFSFSGSSPNNNYNTGIATVTFTTSGKGILCVVGGSIQSSCNTTNHVGVGVMVNGAFTGLDSTTSGRCPFFRAGGAGTEDNMTCNIPIPPQSAGTVRLTLTLYQSLGTGACTFTIPSTSGAPVQNKWGCYEQ